MCNIFRVKNYENLPAEIRKDFQFLPDFYNSFTINIFTPGKNQEKQ